MNQCPCTRNAPNAYLCPTCTNTLRTMLKLTPGLLNSLLVTATRQDHLSTATIRAKTSDKPLPVNLAATWAMKKLERTVTRLWRFSLAGNTYRYLDDPKDQAAAAFYQLDNALTKPEITIIYAALVDAIDHATTAIDRQPERIHLGTCGHLEQGTPCPEDLWTIADEPYLHCPTCGHTWDVKKRQRDMISAAWNVLAYPPDIIRALASQGINISTKHFQNWVQLGHLNPVMTDDDGRRKYRVSDAFKVHQRMANRRRKKAC